MTNAFDRVLETAPFFAMMDVIESLENRNQLTVYKPLYVVRNGYFYP
jgi:hypothetical protein|tara:strand:+ start:187 stop:327 length:141 start_codon:yes stop_codon:yes gene_type:complete